MNILFEQVTRIAKRGRKRWLSLAFVTQLPGHLPRQLFGLVNGYILHKITDPYVVATLSKTVSGIDEGLWKRLPGLAPGQAIVSFGHMTRPLLTSIDLGSVQTCGSWIDSLRFASFAEVSHDGDGDRPDPGALNQVSYCPRLYYLVRESLMINNEHVEDGLFEHRRVADENLANRPTRRGEVLHTRSVALSSERLGITAKLDVIEERDGEAYPVEYKRSTAPRDDDGRPTFWENDAIQLCAQAMLLEEEMGVAIAHGVLYYIGSKERVDVALDDAANEDPRGNRPDPRTVRQPTPPEPLPAELRHRCPGCSLLTICQPEETLHEIGRIERPADEETPGVTRVLPTSHDGAVLYLQEPGSHVGKRSEHLVVRKDGQELQRIPMAAVRQVVVFGHVQVSTQALETLTANEIPVVYLSGYGRFIAARCRPDEERVAAGGAVPPLRRPDGDAGGWRKPWSGEVDESAGAADAFAAFVVGRRRSGARQRDERWRDMAELITRLGVRRTWTRCWVWRDGAALYFGEFGRFLKAQPPGRGFDFSGRNRRPPRDPVNALLSFAYALLAKDCFSALCTVGFDPYHGFFHQGRHGRPSLALDIMEEFRAVIADSVVLTLINNRLVTPEDFLCWREACQLTELGRKKFFGAYESRKSAEVTHPLFGYKMTYSRMLEVQARCWRRTCAATCRGTRVSRFAEEKVSWKAGWCRMTYAIEAVASRGAGRARTSDCGDNIRSFYVESRVAAGTLADSAVQVIDQRGPGAVHSAMFAVRGSDRGAGRPTEAVDARDVVVVV
jgi:CRISPR-associated protein Cas1